MQFHISIEDQEEDLLEMEMEIDIIIKELIIIEVPIRRANIIDIRIRMSILFLNYHPLQN